MNSTARLALLIVLASPVIAAPVSDLSPSAGRATSVDAAQLLLKMLPAPELPDAATINNPFQPSGFDVQEPVAAPVAQSPVQVTVTNRQLLNSLAQTVQPGGTVMLGGRQILLFGQKKLKVGDTLPIVFADKTYEVVIAAIERTSFTLRLNGEEITRPIKTGNTP